MTWARLFSPCWLGHAEPIKVLRGRVLHMECPECCMDLGAVLPGQRYRARREKKLKPRRLAKVLTLQRKDSR